jgi:membrane protein DedA with SNARE-associated domain
MTEALQFVGRHGYAVLFVWVLAEQLGLPMPAIPMLLAAGALAGTGHMSFGTALLVTTVASLLADTIWYEFGRRRGAKVLNLLCRISLEPDSCVRRTENIFARHGTRSLLVAKFVPGLSTAAPPMAGVVGLPRRRFLLYDGLGALLWAASFGLLGYLFADQLEVVALRASTLGGYLVWLLAAALAGYVLWRWHQRRKFLRELVMARITAEELKQRLDAGEDAVIIDLRHPLDFLPHPQVIGNALRLTPEELETRHTEIPRDREVILYCT